MGYQLVETIEVGSGGAASIEFTSIPQDGVDLRLVVSARSSGTFGIGINIKSLAITINNDTTTSNYLARNLRGTGSSVVSQAIANYNNAGFLADSDSTANTFASNSIYFANYTSAVSKSYSIDAVSETNATATGQGLWAYSYATTSPVTSLKALIPGDTFVQYSTASLYKITAD